MRLSEFESSVQTDSRAVICRPLGTLGKLLHSGDGLFQTFYSQVSRGRIPENNAFDPYRGSPDNLFFPFYHEHIHFAALSLDSTGASSYGAGQTCTLVLRDTIANRASLFRENTFMFCRRTKHPATEPIPPGGRATWADRHRLAVAKLGDSITRTTDPADFPALLVRVGGSTGSDEFIEVHIHDPLTPAAVETATLPRVTRKADKLLLKGTMEKLEGLGVTCEKV